MNMGSLDIFLTVAALVAGVMLLTGHGDVFMKGGNASERKKLYDEKKVQKATGIAMILMGIATGLDMVLDDKINAMFSKIGYLVLVIVIFTAITVEKLANVKNKKKPVYRKTKTVL